MNQLQITNKFLLEVGAKKLPRTTTRTQWKEIHRWERVTSKIVRKQMNSEEMQKAEFNFFNFGSSILHITDEGIKSVDPRTVSLRD